MLAWSAMLVLDARLTQETARRSLELVSPSPLIARSEEMPDLLVATIDHPIVMRGAPVGELVIPRVRLSSIVLHGSDAQTLRHGPGHLENTPLPGERGNVAIAGHRDTFFRQLRDVKVGDEVFMNTPRGRFHYQVTSAQVVAPHDLSVLDHTDDDVLTLITCYPFWILGPAPNRFVVRATRVGGAPAAVMPGVGPVETSATLAPNETQPIADHVRAPEAVVHDDEALVRLAVERFRVAYNALLTRDDEAGDGLLAFASCDVAVAGDEAEALCDAYVAGATQRSHHVREFSLTRARGEWAVHSTITTTEEPISPGSEPHFDK